jgi:hypothetical protein
LGEDFWFWALTLGVAVIGGGALALRSLQVARLIEDTPTSRVRSAAQGYVELTGRGLPLDGTQNLGPLTQRPCVWWNYRISKRQEGGKGRSDSWRPVASGHSGQPFLLDDGTGQCIVQPEGAEVVSSESTTWYGDTPWPTTPPGGPSRIGERDYRYFEERIYEHELVYTLGDFRSLGPQAGVDLQGAVTALLAEWKADQARLIDRFDANGDGRVDLAEWEKARAEARRTVAGQVQDRPAVATLHVLSKPDGGRLFLIAALPPGDLAKRYRRRAMLAFAGFVAAVYAFGWLLQGAFG